MKFLEPKFLLNLQSVKQLMSLVEAKSFSTWTENKAMGWRCLESGVHCPKYNMTQISWICIQGWTATTELDRLICVCQVCSAFCRTVGHFTDSTIYRFCQMLHFISPFYFTESRHPEKRYVDTFSSECSVTWLSSPSPIAVFAFSILSLEFQDTQSPGIILLLVWAATRAGDFKASWEMKMQVPNFWTPLWLYDLVIRNKHHCLHPLWLSFVIPPVQSGLMTSFWSLLSGLCSSSSILFSFLYDICSEMRSLAPIQAFLSVFMLSGKTWS